MAIDDGVVGDPKDARAEWDRHLLTFGLSVWESELLQHFSSHGQKEQELLDGYAELAESSPNRFVRYLASMLIEDERRHHRMFLDLANALLGEANLTSIEPAVPDTGHITDAAQLRDRTARYLALEEEDQKELKRLRKMLKPVRDTTMWDLLVSIAERDTEKHRMILEFLHRQAVEGA